jgi:hypothetical protein
MVVVNFSPGTNNSNKITFIHKYAQIAVNSTETGSWKVLSHPVKDTVRRGMIRMKGY